MESIEVLTYNYPCTEKRKCVRTFVVDMDWDAVCDEDGNWAFGSQIEKIDCPDVENSSSGSVAKSSSSVAKSSSSVAKSSSSVASSSSNTPVDYVTGTLTDSRDGQVYKTVTIGTQTWMAENLNYAYTGVKYAYSDYISDSSSWCYNDIAKNCDKYGRLYTWSAAMDSAAQFSTADKGGGYDVTCSISGTVRGVCPEGWHVPNDDEWNTLWVALGGTSTAGTVLKSASGWFENGNGTDKYGFSVLPAGLRSEEGYFKAAGDLTIFWSSSENSSSENDWEEASRWKFNSSFDEVRHSYYYKKYGFSVRCLRDSE